jgi:competence ComEA-like helix-hairpin-helix protein
MRTCPAPRSRLLLLPLLLACACAGASEPIVFRPLPPDLAYPWADAVAARESLSLAQATARARLLVASAVADAAAVAVPPPPVEPPPLVDLNTATEEELDGLPRVGPAMAAAIVAARPYRRVEDLRRVRGVGDATFAVLRPLITVAPAP